MKILKFGADAWCPSCKTLGAQLKSIGLYDKVEDIDVDSSPEKVKEFGIRGIPCLVLVKDDKEVSRLQGSQKIEALQDWFDKASAL